MIGDDTLVAASAALEARQISAVELCEQTIQKIERLNPQLSAYSDCLFDTARQEAGESDQRRRAGEAAGQIDGIPFAIKDLIDTVPAVCRGGLKSLSDYRPKGDASVVARLRAAGAVIVGVTETDAGGFGTTTPQCVNPIAPQHIAGGSSGGSAVAIASGMAFGAIGTDTGGSIRIPAACCCVYGFKPTWGRVDAEGARPLARSFDHIGGLARSVRDLIAIQRCIDPTLNRITHDNAERPRRVGIAYSFFAHATPIVMNAMREVERRLGTAGVRCGPVVLPGQDVFMNVHIENALKEAFDYYQAFDAEGRISYPPVARDSLAIGSSVSDQAYACNELRRISIKAMVEAIFDQVEVVILPVLPIGIPETDVDFVALDGRDIPLLDATINLTALFNITGHPVVSMPAHRLSDGMAMSIQVVGRQHSDARLLSIARWIEILLDVHIDHAELCRKYLQASANGSQNE